MSHSAHHACAGASYGRHMPLLLIGFILIALLVELASSAAHMLIAMVGAGAVCFRTWAVLARKPEDTLKWWTAVGSAVGAAGMILIVLVDLALEGG